ncbi:ABC transporter permease [Pediococcus acidilactici]|uniref:ABC transporter permease n=1 Tax=Pediococcus acidilactici TaxID=1254 RepID=UPI001F20A515|nr:ABC transporter permease [Pediococcus acidilactici]
MNKLWEQLKFDGKRLVFRNPSFLIMSPGMPAFFYWLFTKLFTNPATNNREFAGSYLGSMMVYSLLITLLMGMSTALIRDRNEGLTVFLKLNHHRLENYYASFLLWNTLKNFMAIGILGMVAAYLNAITLDPVQWLSLLGLILVGKFQLCC